MTGHVDGQLREKYLFTLPPRLKDAGACGMGVIGILSR